MITKEELNKDQLKSYLQMIETGGIIPRQALELIDEYCVNQHFTGLKVYSFRLTEKGHQAVEKLSVG